MKRFYSLGGFVSLILFVCFFSMTPVSAQYNGPGADLIDRIFGRANNNAQGERTVQQIRQSEDQQYNCYLEICAEEHPNAHNLAVCQEWAQEAFGRSDCDYVNAAVNVEYRCVDEYRCLANPNQTNLSRGLRSACDAVLQEKFETAECSLLRPSLVSSVFANLSEQEKRDAIRIQNPSAEASTCVQTICSNQSGETVRARDLRVCSGWADLRLGVTDCSDMRRVVDDGSIESRSYRMTQEDEFTCVAAMCGESFVQISPEEERFCQDWATHWYGTNQCNTLLDAYAPEERNKDGDLFNLNKFLGKRFDYNLWKQRKNQEGQSNTPQEQNRLDFNRVIAYTQFLNLRDAYQLDQCIPLLLGEEIQREAQNNKNLSFAACEYLAEEYQFYQNPNQAQLTQCQILLAGNRQGENSDIERVRCRYWLARAQRTGENQLIPNENMFPAEENAQVDTPELFFENVSYADGVYTITVANSGFIPNTVIQPQLSARWIPHGEGWQSHRNDFTQLRLMVQPTGERRWIFNIDTDDVSRSFPPEDAQYLEFVIDPANSIEERNENNNAWAVAPRPDFRVLDTGNPEIIRTGNIPVVITNSSPRSEFEGSVPFLFQWFGSQGQLISSVDGIAGMIARNRTYRGDLAVAEIPDGAVRFKITANPNQRIPEMNQQNNSFEYFFAPDLVIDQVITQKDSLVVRVQNIGNSEIPLADFNVRALYQSENNFNLDTSQQGIRQEQEETQWTLRFPLSSIPNEAVSVRFMVDSESLVFETNEANNTADYALNERGLLGPLNQGQGKGNAQNQEKRDAPQVLPGDAFYGIKEVWRSLRLGLTFNANKKAEYMLDLAENRANERLELFKQGREIPENAPKILDVKDFVQAVKNIPGNQSEHKQDLLKKSIAHIEFEYETGPQKNAEPIVFEYKPEPKDGEVIVFEYAPQPIDGEVIVYEYKPMEQFSRDFVHIMNTAGDERHRRDLLNTLTGEKYGSAQKHLQNAIKLSHIAKIAPKEIQPLIVEKENLLVKKVTESIEQETPAQQRVLINTVRLSGQNMVPAKAVLENLEQEIRNEGVKKTLITPKLQEINALLSTKKELPDTSKNEQAPTSSVVIPPITTEPECRDDNTMVCGKDGKTYTSKCSALKLGITVVSAGKCPEPTPIPPKIPEPIITKPTSTIVVPPPLDCSKQGTRSVCGANGKTYSNTCYAEKDGIKVTSQGACPIKTVPPAPECTSNSACDDKNSCTENACVNGKCVYTRYNACGTREYSCTDGIDNDRNGKVDCADTACSSLTLCAPKPTCDDGEPVCGRDGITYTSECAAKAKGVIVDSFGRCPVIHTNTQTNTQINTTLNTNTNTKITNTNTQTTNTQTTNTQTTNTNNTTTQTSQKIIKIVNGSFESQSFSMSSSQTLVIQNLDEKEYNFGGGTIPGPIAPKGTKTINFPSIGQYTTYLHENPSDVIIITVGE